LVLPKYVTENDFLAILGLFLAPGRGPEEVLICWRWDGDTWFLHWAGVIGSQLILATGLPD